MCIPFRVRHSPIKNNINIEPRVASRDAGLGAFIPFTRSRLFEAEAQLSFRLAPTESGESPNGTKQADFNVTH